MSNAWHYPLRYQHDVAVHLGYLRELAQLHLPQTYNAPWYYLLLCCLGAPAVLVCKALDVSEMALATAAVGLGNTVFFALYFLGMLRLARALRFSHPDSLLIAILAATFPVVHRTFSMVRPENLILTLLPWCLWFTLRWRDPGGASLEPPKGWAFWSAAAATAVAASQKLGGLSVVAGVGTLALTRDAGPIAPRLRRLVPALLCGCGLIALLMAAHFLLSGASPFVHDPDPALTCPPPPGFFVRVDPAALWEQPIRNAHRGSMPGILLADMYGDYWQYGYDAGPMKPPLEVSVRRGRLGLALTLTFCLLACPAAVLLVHGAFASQSGTRARSLERLCCLLPALFGVLYLAAAALQIYRPADGDIIKWEYISWCFPCAALLLGDLASRASGTVGCALRATLVTLAVGGLVQSVIL